MSTTSLLVEYLILGVIADIWLSLMLLQLYPSIRNNIQFYIDNISKVDTIFLIIFLAITYTLGGIVNYLSDIFFNKPQKNYRDTIFEKKGYKYKDIRGIISHKASPDASVRFRFDGHLIRVFRGNALNFLVLAIILISYFKDDFSIIYLIVLCFVFSIFSIFQWRKRYISNYDQLLGEYEAILAEQKKSSSTIIGVEKKEETSKGGNARKNNQVINSKSEHKK